MREQGVVMNARSKMQRLSDRELVYGCLAGAGEAWSDLVDRYKNLVFRVANRSSQGNDAVLLFTAVWIEVYNELQSLSDLENLRVWFIRKTLEVCGSSAVKPPSGVDSGIDSADESLVAELELQELCIEAIGSLPARCQELLRLLVTSNPSDDELAEMFNVSPSQAAELCRSCLLRFEMALRRRGLV